MRRLWYLAVVACLAGGISWPGGAATVPMPNPDDGKVRDGVFTSGYFNLSYPLPTGWTEGLAGPEPSISGYYVLNTLIPAGELTGTILIAAQDNFFAAKPLADAIAAAGELSRSMSAIDGMTIDRPPSEMRIAGRRFGRVDFSGVGLFRSTLITKIRCHYVSFNLTAKSPELLSGLVRSLDNLGFAGGGAERVDPECVGNYADAAHLVTKVDPVATGPSFIPIPVRIIIGADGSVEHVHVIRATGGQRESIERALDQWKFKPDGVDRHASAIETGVLLDFTPKGATQYLTGNRSPTSANSSRRQ
jgi:hypothetical protein